MSRKVSRPTNQRAPNNVTELTAVRNHASLWNDLTRLQAQCYALNQSPMQVVQLLRNKELVSQIADKASILQLANTLNKDIQQYSDRMNQLNQTADQYRGQLEDAHVLAALMDVASAYDDWITSYQLVVVPTAIQITDLFNQLTQSPQV